MEIITDIDNLKIDHSIVILGKFDGFHLGHSLLLDHARLLKTEDRKIVLLTFDIFPLQILKSEKKLNEADDLNLKSIDSREEREFYWKEKFEGIVDYIIEFPFNRKTMSMLPEDFVREILINKLGVCAIIAGDDFHFGKGRSGDINTLRKLGAEYGFTADIVDKAVIKPLGYDKPVQISSTLIKQEIQKGNMENAQMMLGRPYCISGTVIHGKHLGSAIGFPTANIDVPSGKVLPPMGVYYTDIHVENEGIFHGITNLGKRPTFNDGEKISVEPHIFNFSKDIYGCRIKVDFIRFIRPEMKFKSIDELKDQIELDKISARSF